MDAAQPRSFDRPRRRSDEPATSPFALRALAIGHFVFAALIVGVALVNHTVEGSAIDQSMANTLGVVDSPAARKLQHDLKRTATIKDGLSQQMKSRLPAASTVANINQIVDIALALLLFGAGTCLLQKQPLAWPLSMGFAGVCLVQRVAMLCWLSLAEVPQAKEYLAMIKRVHPKDAELIDSILTPIANGPMYQVILAIYPLIVLAVMLQPSIKAALAPQPAGPPRKPELAPPSEPLALPQVVEVNPSPAISQDPLEALLQRKTF